MTDQSEETTRLLEKARDGDQAALNQLFTMHHSRLRRMVELRLDRRLQASPQRLADALTGRFRDIHAFEIATHLRLIDTINDEIARLDERIEQQRAAMPGVAPACTACGLIGGGHAPVYRLGALTRIEQAGVAIQAAAGDQARAPAGFLQLAAAQVNVLQPARAQDCLMNRPAPRLDREAAR